MAYNDKVFARLSKQGGSHPCSTKASNQWGQRSVNLPIHTVYPAIRELFKMMVAINPATVGGTLQWANKPGRSLYSVCSHLRLVVPGPILIRLDK